MPSTVDVHRSTRPTGKKSSKKCIILDTVDEKSSESPVQWLRLCYNRSIATKRNYIMQTREDRLALIKAAAEKLQAKQAKAFPVNTFVKATATKKPGRKASRSQESIEDTDESFMYDDEKAVQRIWKDSGVMESYSNTTRYDSEWN